MPKTIVMTGVSSGIGRTAAESLAKRGWRVIGGDCNLVPLHGVETRPLDLGDLDNVKAFAHGLEGLRLDALSLNAGVQGYDVKARTAQGFELAFGVNHLAHYLLARLLMPQIAAGGRLVFTTSGTHDPAERSPIPPPRHANAEWMAWPERDPELDRHADKAGLRAYSSSKLCNILTARAFAAGNDVHIRGVRVFAYDPGLTPGTELIRRGPFLVRRLFWPFLSAIQPFSRGINSLADAGRGLADLCDGTETGDLVYCSNRRGKLKWVQPSALALDDDLGAKLWRGQRGDGRFIGGLAL